jgi:hypothetical protein
MNKRKLVPLLILPLLLVLAVPLTSHAQSSSYELFVSCRANSTQSEVSSVVFLGHFVIITCPPNSGFHSSGTFFTSALGGTYVGTGEAGGQVDSAQGSFGPYGCGVEAVVYTADHSSWAYWEILTSECD